MQCGAFSCALLDSDLTGFPVHILICILFFTLLPSSLTVHGRLQESVVHGRLCQGKVSVASVRFKSEQFYKELFIPVLPLLLYNDYNFQTDIIITER